MAEIIELKINFIQMGDGMHKIWAGVYDLPITKETLPVLVETAEKVRYHFNKGCGIY
jgi:hypothetical protein